MPVPITCQQAVRMLQGQENPHPKDAQPAAEEVGQVGPQPLGNSTRITSGEAVLWAFSPEVPQGADAPLLLTDL